MTIWQTDKYIRACMNTWLLCEACMHCEKECDLPDKKLIKAWGNCGQSCISILARLISDPSGIHKNVFDCFLYCVNVIMNSYCTRKRKTSNTVVSFAKIVQKQ